MKQKTHIIKKTLSNSLFSDKIIITPILKINI